MQTGDYETKIAVMIHCPYCEGEIAQGLELCPQCGANLKAAAKLEHKGFPKFVHPFAVMGYIVIISALLAFLQIRAQAARKPAPEKAAVKSVPAVPARPPALVKEIITPQNTTETDKRYMEVAGYEKAISPIFAAVTDIDSRLSDPGFRLDFNQMSAWNSILNRLSRQAENTLTPTGLGPCQPAVKNSVDQMNSALTASWNYQSKKSPDAQGQLNESLNTSRSQKNYCLSVIDILKKDLEKSGLSHGAEALIQNAILPGSAGAPAPVPAQEGVSPAGPAAQEPAPAEPPAPPQSRGKGVRARRRSLQNPQDHQIPPEQPPPAVLPEEQVEPGESPVDPDSGQTVEPNPEDFERPPPEDSPEYQ